MGNISTQQLIAFSLNGLFMFPRMNMIYLLCKTHLVVCHFETDIEILLKESYELGLYMGAQI
jgi:hypothetical protein